MAPPTTCWAPAQIRGGVSTWDGGDPQAHWQSGITDLGVFSRVPRGDGPVTCRAAAGPGESMDALVKLPGTAFHGPAE